jgi:hypothetical protein
MSSFPISSITRTTLKNWSVKLTNLAKQVTELISPLEWGSWQGIAKASGSMTFTITGNQDYKYFRILNTVFFACSAVGTTGGTAGAYLNFSLPFPVSDEVVQYSISSVIIAGNIYAGVGLVDTNREGVNVYMYDASNWTLGTNRQFRCSGFYKRRA